MSEKVWIIPPAKSRYLSEISENNRRYDAKVEKQATSRINCMGCTRLC
jgi:methylmalonyl-CoA mutase